MAVKFLWFLTIACCLKLHAFFRFVAACGSAKIVKIVGPDRGTNPIRDSCVLAQLRNYDKRQRRLEIPGIA